MKKIAACLLSLLFLWGCEAKEIEFEEEFKLEIAVNDQNYADRFKLLWQQIYPEYEGNLEISVVDEQTIFKLATTETEIPYDLYWIHDSLVPWVIEDCLKFPKGYADSFEVADFEAYSSTLNEVKEVYSGLTANGLFYAVDLNQIEEKGLNLDDFNSFETMSDIDNSFYYYDHELYNLPLLSSDVRYFPGKQQIMLDFESEAFQISKDNFQSIVGMLELESDASGFDNWFIEQDYVSGLIGEWMQVEENEEMNGITYQYRKLPMIKEYQLKTAASSYGVVINQNTLYPNAALKCLRLMHSIKGMQILCEDDNNGYPLIPEDMIEQFTFNDIHIKEKAIALNASFQENLVGVYNKEEKGAMDYLEDEEVIDMILECVDDVCDTQLQEDYEVWLQE